MSADHLADAIESSTDRAWLAWIIAAGPWLTVILIILHSSIPGLPNVLLWGAAAAVVSIKVLGTLAGQARWIDAPARWSRAAVRGIFRGRGPALAASVAGFLVALLAAQLQG